MDKRGAVTEIVAVVVLLTLACHPIPALAEGNPARGRIFYRTGEAQGPAEVQLVGPSLTSQASGFPCGRCHGADGRGTDEGGVTVPGLVWDSVESLEGRRRRITAAIRDGIGHDGMPIAQSMPRYHLAPTDLDDLLAYLEVIGREPVPGVSDNEIRIGFVLPRSGPFMQVGEEIGRFLASLAQQVNRYGIYGRQIRIISMPADPGKELLPKEDVLCFVANLISGREDDVPVIGPLFDDPSRSSQMLVVRPDLEQQVLALASPDAGPIATPIRVITTSDPAARRATTTYLDALHASGMLGEEVRAEAANTVTLAGSSTVVLFGPARLLDQLISARAIPRNATLLGLRDLWGRQGEALARTWTGAAIQAEPAETPLKEGKSHNEIATAAADAFSILLDGLRHTGRRVTRDRLVEVLHRHDRFTTPSGLSVHFGKDGRNEAPTAVRVNRLGTNQ